MDIINITWIKQCVGKEMWIWERKLKRFKDFGCRFYEDDDDVQYIIAILTQDVVYISICQLDLIVQHLGWWLRDST